MSAPESGKRMRFKRDWTFDGSVCASSPQYDDIVNFVSGLIRNSASMLIDGQVHQVAGFIVSQLAHGRFKMRPGVRARKPDAAGERQA
jgi:hypothetical protein